MAAAADRARRAADPEFDWDRVHAGWLDAEGIIRYLRREFRKAGSDTTLMGTGGIQLSAERDVNGILEGYEVLVPIGWIKP